MTEVRCYCGKFPLTWPPEAYLGITCDKCGTVVRDRSMTISRERTKQEGIREGIKDIFSGWGIGNWDIDHSAIDDLLNYLDSQGVVLKVERELPDEDTSDIKQLLGVEDEYNCLFYYFKAQETMLKAGYTAVEPLVKEVK